MKIQILPILVIFLLASIVACNSQSQPVIPPSQQASIPNKEELTVEDYNISQVSVPEENKKTTNSEWNLVRIDESTGKTYITPYSINDVILDEVLYLSL